MGVSETLYDIIEYVSKQKCHGRDIRVTMRECLNGIQSFYVMKMSTYASVHVVFEKEYDIHYFDLDSLGSVRQKVNDILQDFCDDFNKEILKED